MKAKVSVIIPCYNAEKTIGKTLGSLKSQTFKDFELIVVDDASTDGSASIAKANGAKVISLSNHAGPAAVRNAGLKKASGSIILFTDSDCQPALNWVENAVASFNGGNQAAVMGKVNVPNSTFFANSIAQLGFPAGANAGFENMWPVSKEGFTEHLSSCNLAIKKEAIESVGCFDESFPYAGGEDTYLAFLLSKNGMKIRYCPNVVVFHEPTGSWRKFLRWQLTRGKANYHFRKKVGGVKKYVGLRIWSSKNIMEKNLFTKYSLPTFFLLSISFFLQQAGYLSEWLNQTKK